MAEWRIVRLEAVASVTVGHVGSMVDEYRSDGVPFLRSQNVRPHRIDLNDIKFINTDFHAALKKSALKPGDVVTVRTGAPGTTAVIPESLPVANCSDLVITRPGPDLQPNWLSYYLNWVIDSHIAGHLVGAVQQHFNVKSAKGLELVLPELGEQRAIAEVLGALDGKIAANGTLAAAANTLALAYYDQAVLDVPEVAMSSMLTPVLGGTPSRSHDSYWGGSIRWASAKDVTSCGFGVVLETAETITDLAVDATKAKPLPIGSVILTARGTVGAVARLAIPCSLNQSCYGFVPGAVPPGVLYFSILRATERAKELAHGSVFDTITMRTFDHLALPDAADPRALDAEPGISALLGLVAQAVRESQALTGLRDTLLPELMSGRLRVRDAEQAVGELV